MPILTDLDGKLYELDEATLAKFQIADPTMGGANLLPALKWAAPPEPPPATIPPHEMAAYYERLQKEREARLEAQAQVQPKP